MDPIDIVIGFVMAAGLLMGSPLWIVAMWVVTDGAIRLLAAK